jgi:mannose-1-phosphate guanylyltransferase
MSSVHEFAVILAGGGGTRLWPASRRKRPKQLLTLAGEECLLTSAFRRAKSIFGGANTLVVTTADQAEAVRLALPDLPPENLVSEPVARNTAAAVGLGTALVARRAGDDAVLAILPSDAFIGNEAEFARILRLALDHARQTITIKPTYPETGFGYLRVGVEVAPGVFEVGAFVEKPNAEKARQYLNANDHFWNSGMFFFTAGRLLAETRRQLPALGQVLDELRAAPDVRATTLALYPGVPAISIDFGIMEKASRLRVVPGDFGWNDVGSWAALAAIGRVDDAANVVSGDAVALKTSGSIVISEPGAPFVGVVGADDLVVVATRDAVLVVPKAKAQDVRVIVEAALGLARLDPGPPAPRWMVRARAEERPGSRWWGSDGNQTPAPAYGLRW